MSSNTGTAKTSYTSAIRGGIVILETEDVIVFKKQKINFLIPYSYF